MTKGLNAGASTLTINPKIGTNKGGLRLFGGPIESIESDIYCSSLVLESKSVKLVLITCDLGNLSINEANEVRQEVASSLKIPFLHVMLNISHSHSAPAPVVWDFSSYSPDQVDLQREYLTYFRKRVLTCAQDADKNLGLPQIEWVV